MKFRNGIYGRIRRLYRGGERHRNRREREGMGKGEYPGEGERIREVGSRVGEKMKEY